MEKLFIFRTSITSKQEVTRLDFLLRKYPDVKRWSVDLEDWEKVLRVECIHMNALDIAAILRVIGIYAVELE